MSSKQNHEIVVTETICVKSKDEKIFLLYWIYFIYLLVHTKMCQRRKKEEFIPYGVTNTISVRVLLV